MESFVIGSWKIKGFKFKRFRINWVFKFDEEGGNNFDG